MKVKRGVVKGNFGGAGRKEVGIAQKFKNQIICQEI